MRTILIYGARGKAGRLVMERASERGWAVAAFVRNPDKVPEALRAKVMVIKGDLCDAAAVAAAVRSSRPDAIVDASSALPFGHAKGQPANNADRSIFSGRWWNSASRGALRAEPTENNLQRGSASYCDVADALVRLAGDAERTWERKALFFNYAGAAG